MKYRVGDRVQATDDVALNEDLRGKPGVIKALDGSYYWVEIEGHPSPTGPHNFSWHFSEQYLTPGEPEDVGPTDEEIAALFNVKPCTKCGCTTNGRH